MFEECITYINHQQRSVFVLWYEMSCSGFMAFQVADTAIISFSSIFWIIFGTNVPSVTSKLLIQNKDLQPNAMVVLQCDYSSKKWSFHGSLHCLYSFQMGKILEDLLGVRICSVCLVYISITFEPTRAHQLVGVALCIPSPTLLCGMFQPYSVCLCQSLSCVCSFSGTRDKGGN